MNLFVKKSDTIKVCVYAYEDDSNVNATIEKDDIPEKTKYQTLHFTFRKPAYSDSRDIIKLSNLKPISESEVAEIDVITFQDVILQTLLIGWDIKDEHGKNVDISQKTIGTLQPAIARAAVGGAISKIKI